MIDTNNPDENTIYPFKGDDPAMEQAFKEARKTFKFLWRELSWEYRRIVPGLDLACVKVAFRTDGDEGAPEAEHMWLNELMFDGYLIRGVLVNEPQWVTSVQQGDDVSVTINDIGDWMYATSGEVYGAYTVNVMRANMGNGERRSHDAAWGLDFGDPNSIRLTYDSGGKKKGFLSRMFSGKEDPKTAAELEQTDHPMCINMGDSLKEAIASDSEFITGVDEIGNTLLHSEAIAGNCLSVQALLAGGADRNLKNNHGHTPLDLAKMMNWPMVIDALS